MREAMLTVISGCSGGGKSALLDEMARRGWQVYSEPGRRVLRAERASGGDGLPWENMTRFAALCVALAEADHEQAMDSGAPALFDRSILDAVAALERLGLPVSAAQRDAVERLRYAPVVFMAPPWEALFAQDDERRHGFGEAVAEHDHLTRRYAQAGYEVAPLPKLGIAARADWLEARLEAEAHA